MNKYDFPPDFLWGSGTASYQLEGGNIWCDWYEFEKKPGRVKNNDRCGAACDHYNRYASDFKIAKGLNQNSHRLSIEWSRIEKKEGVIDKKEIAHYRAVLKELKSSGFTTFVTLHHFSTPTWMSRQGGWANKGIVAKLSNYAALCAAEFGDLVDFWDTINEPMVYATQGYLTGNWVPGKHNPVSFIKCLMNMRKAHLAAYHTIKKVRPEANVGIVYNFAFYVPSGPVGRIIKGAWDYLRNYFFLDRLNNQYDHIGVNYYFPDGKVKNTKRTDQNWVIYPNGLREALIKVSKRYNKVLYITENGIADSRDDRRIDFIKDHILATHQAIVAGAKVGGYSYWSLLDFFEWADGFEPRFGLVAVDYATQKRTIRKSADYYAKICKDNSICL